MKIALVGAGAVGAYFIWGFDKADPKEKEFTVIAEGDRRDRLAAEGIRVNKVTYHPAVKSPEEAGPQDLVIVAVKGNTLSDAVKLLPPLMGEKTAVVSMLNGGDSEDVIASVVGREHVLHSIILIASRRANGEVVFDTEYDTTIYYGAVDIPDGKILLETVRNAFSDTPIKAIESSDIMYDVWSKYAKNICNNLPQAILGIPAALYTRSEHGLFLAKKLWAEVRTLARIRGIELPEEVGIYPCADSSRYSTLQDIDAGRRTEVDSLCGYLLDLAAENKVDVPYIEYTYHAIKALEEKNDGVFD